MRRSKDLPDVLLHLTSREGAWDRDDPSGLRPDERLARILTYQHVLYGDPYEAGWPSVSFMQSTRTALCDRIPKYPSTTGIAFDKQTIWNAGGGPVYYVRGDRWTAWKKSGLPEPMKGMASRYWPGWSGDKGGSFTDENKGPSEWLHEREWRIPAPEQSDDSWSFELSNVAFLVFPDPDQRHSVLDCVGELGGDRGAVEQLPWCHKQDGFAGVPEGTWW